MGFFPITMIMQSQTFPGNNWGWNNGWGWNNNWGNGWNNWGWGYNSTSSVTYSTTYYWG